MQESGLPPRPADNRKVRRFGAFEVDLKSGELRRNGLRIRLEPKPFQVLEALLERAGEVVTREELRARLWQGVHLEDFDRSLDIAVAKLRAALGDPAKNPRLIETLPRHGYRFIAPVIEISDVGTPLKPAVAVGRDADAEVGVRAGQEKRPPGTPLPEPRAARSLWRRRPTLTFLAGCAVAAAILFSIFLIRPLPTPRVLGNHELTHDHQGKQGPLLTDGPRLYFGASKDGHLVQAWVPAAGGDVQVLASGSPDAIATDVSPDGSQFLGKEGSAPDPASRIVTWLVMGGPTQPVGDLRGVCG